MQQKCKAQGREVVKYGRGAVPSSHAIAYCKHVPPKKYETWVIRGRSIKTKLIDSLWLWHGILQSRVDCPGIAIELFLGTSCWLGYLSICSIVAPTMLLRNHMRGETILDRSRPGVSLFSTDFLLTSGRARTSAMWNVAQ